MKQLTCLGVAIIIAALMFLKNTTKQSSTGVIYESRSYKSFDQVSSIPISRTNHNQVQSTYSYISFVVYDSLTGEKIRDHITRIKSVNGLVESSVAESPSFRLLNGSYLAEFESKDYFPHIEEITVERDISLPVYLKPESPNVIVLNKIFSEINIKLFSESGMVIFNKTFHNCNTVILNSKLSGLHKLVITSIDHSIYTADLNFPMSGVMNISLTEGRELNGRVIPKIRNFIVPLTLIFTNSRSTYRTETAFNGSFTVRGLTRDNYRLIIMAGSDFIAEKELTEYDLENYIEITL